MQNAEREEKYRRQNKLRGAKVPDGNNGLTDRQLRRIKKNENRHKKQTA